MQIPRSNIFSRCPDPECNGLMIMGVCQSCGFLRCCSWCKDKGIYKVRQADGSYRNQGFIETPRTSHGICPECLRAEKEKILAAV